MTLEIAGWRAEVLQRVLGEAWASGREHSHQAALYWMRDAASLIDTAPRASVSRRQSRDPHSSLRPLAPRL